MAKLEELTELLVSEIRDFEEAVKKLEEIRKAKITIDIAELKNLFANQKKVLEHQDVRAQHIYDETEKLIKDAKIYPKWVVILFIFSLALNCIIFSFWIFNN